MDVTSQKEKSDALRAGSEIRIREILDQLLAALGRQPQELVRSD